MKFCQCCLWRLSLWMLLLKNNGDRISYSSSRWLACALEGRAWGGVGWSDSTHISPHLFVRIIQKASKEYLFFTSVVHEHDISLWQFRLQKNPFIPFHCMECFQNPFIHPRIHSSLFTACNVLIPMRTEHKRIKEQIFKSIPMKMFGENSVF